MGGNAAMALFLMETSSLGRKEGALGVRPLWSSSDNFDYPNDAPTERVTQYGVYRKSHWVQDVPLAYSVPVQRKMVSEFRNRAAFPGSSLTLAVTETMMCPSTR